MKNDGEAKQVIMVRKDLKMPVGKIAAQVAHASLAAVLKKVTKEKLQGGTLIKRELLLHELDPVHLWLENRFTKVVVGVDSEEEMLAIFNKASENKLLACALITDAGFTVFDGVPTNTCCSIGPGFIKDIDELTGHLKLLK